MFEHVDDDGIWCELRAAEPAGWAAGRPALFLDRDGVIVEDVRFLHRPGEVRLIAGAAEVVAMANRRGIPVIAVTNQSGIGRGFYGWPDFAATEAQIASDLAAVGGRLDMVIACPHHPDGKPPYDHPAHPCRKPQPGMIRRAADRLDLDLARSWIVGDKVSDLAAGSAAGLAGGLHVLTGHGGAERAQARQFTSADFDVCLAESIAGAMDVISRLQRGV